MTDREKQIAEEIILLMWYNQKHSYYVNWLSLSRDNLKYKEISYSDFNDLKDSIKDSLIELGLIKHALSNNPHDYVLTTKGKSFTSFQDMEHQIEKKEKAASWKEWPQRNWHWIAIATFILTSIAAPLVVEKLKPTLLPTPTEERLKFEKTDSGNHQNDSFP